MKTIARKGILPFVACLFMIVICLFPGCFQTDDTNDVEIQDFTDEGAWDEVSSSDVVNANNRFAFELYLQLLDSYGQDQNIFFSPWSITVALSMAYEGAEGDTAKEMEDVLHISLNDTDRQNDFKSNLQTLDDPNNDYELSNANAFWACQDYHFEQAYFDILEEYYLSQAEELDFKGDPEGSRETINTWVEENTNDKIKDLIPPGIIDSMTRLVLTNAIYFKGQWIYQFDPEATEDMEFTTAKNVEKDVPTMRMCDESIDLKYAESDDLQVLELPYEGDELSMIILLPKDNDITTLESSLTSTYVDDIVNKLSSTWVDIYLPKFKFDDKYFLEKDLPKMGMEKAFSEDADFSGITGDDDIYISSVVHQSFVDVNEEGTEAAAATAVIMQEKGAGGGDEKKPVVFRADHPFIFLIKHNDSDNILFLGKVSDPMD